MNKTGILREERIIKESIEELKVIQTALIRENSKLESNIGLAKSKLKELHEEIVRQEKYEYDLTVNGAILATNVEDMDTAIKKLKLEKAMLTASIKEIEREKSLIDGKNAEYEQALERKKKELDTVEKKSDAREKVMTKTNTEVAQKKRALKILLDEIKVAESRLKDVLSWIDLVEKRKKLTKKQEEGINAFRKAFLGNN